MLACTAGRQTETHAPGPNALVQALGVNTPPLAIATSGTHQPAALSQAVKVGLGGCLSAAGTRASGRQCMRRLRSVQQAGSVAGSSGVPSGPSQAASGGPLPTASGLLREHAG